LDKVSSCIVEVERQRKIIDRLFQDRTPVERQYIENMYLNRALETCESLIEGEALDEESFEFQLMRKVINYLLGCLKNYIFLIHRVFFQIEIYNVFFKQ
jgi:hypothetical protein